MKTNIMFKCPYNEFSCPFIDTAYCTLDCRCVDCEHYNKGIKATGATPFLETVKKFFSKFFIVAILLTGYTVNASEPIESCVIVKQSYQEVKQLSFQSKPRFTMKEKTIHCIIVQTALFAVGEYALQTRNKQLWNAYAITFVGTIPLSAIYLRKGKPSKGHYSY